MEEDKKIPYSLYNIGYHINGCINEIFPQLLILNITQKKLDDFADNLIHFLQSHYPTQMFGSILWIIYKEVCNKNINILVNNMSTDENLLEIIHKLTWYQEKIKRIY